MIYTAIDTFYLTDEQLEDSPSKKDGIDKATETTLRIYGCDLIQESGILLKLPQAVMAIGQVLFHRFYCKKSFARFNVKRVAASCTWLASKLEESPRKARQVLIVLHRMECRRENLPLEHLDIASKKYADLKADLIRTERHLLKEMGFICHVEHPHKFISNYLATLETPAEVRQEAWNLANDSLRTTLCVRFKSEVVACGVVYAATRRFQIPLPEDPPWWLAFDADKSGIEEVCRVLAHLYSLPKAQYISVCKEGGSFTNLSNNNKSWDSAQPVGKEGPSNGSTMNADTPNTAANKELGKDVPLRVALDKSKDSKKSDPESRGVPVEEEGRAESAPQLQGENRTEAGGERNIERGRERDRDRDRNREREREKDKGGKTSSRGHDRGSKSDRERDREDTETERQRVKDNQGHRSRDKGKDSGHGEKAKHHSSRDRGYHSSSYSSSREKERSSSRHH